MIKYRKVYTKPRLEKLKGKAKKDAGYLYRSLETCRIIAKIARL